MVLFVLDGKGHDVVVVGTEVVLCVRSLGANKKVGNRSIRLIFGVELCIIQSLRERYVFAQLLLRWE